MISCAPKACLVKSMTCVALGVWLTCAVELAWRDRPAGDRKALGGLILLLTPTVFPGVNLGLALMLAGGSFLTGQLSPGLLRE